MTVLVPTGVAGAVEALAHHPGAMLLAGGTDLLVDVNAGRSAPASVVSLRKVDELRTVEVGPTAVRLGAGVTYTRLLEDDIASAVPALAQAARTVGSPQIRNAGTLGGNLGTASPAGTWDWRSRREHGSCQIPSHRPTSWRRGSIAPAIWAASTPMVISNSWDGLTTR